MSLGRYALAAAFALFAGPAAAVELTPGAHGVEFRTESEIVRVQFCAPHVVHVRAVPRGHDGAATSRPWIRQACANLPPIITPMEDGRIMLDAGQVKVEVSTSRGNLVFLAPDGARLLGEVGNAPRHYRPAAVNPDLLDVEIVFHPQLDHAFYGLGQNQSGLFNYQGAVVELAQSNANIAIPYLVSTAGYGLFWNSAAAARVDNRFPTELKISGESADGIDYLFVYGPEMDDLVAAYRELTGGAPMFPRWAFGLFQSMDHYATGEQLLSAARRNRQGGSAFDVIVQDWRWWTRMGDFEFKPAEYSNVPATLDEIHDMNLHAMISIWPLLSRGSEHFVATRDAGQLIPETNLYDPTNEAAAQRYWDLLAGPLIEQGWDALWLDGTEPELHLSHMALTDRTLQGRALAIGPGELYNNYFPFAHSLNISSRWRDARDDKRVFILSRSSFAGVQAHGAASWSGDILPTFNTLQKQIAGGLNFALSGMPYWTTDIGGYYYGVLDQPSHGPDPRDEDYQETYARWWQYGAFNPLFRTHGKRVTGDNSVFAYGDMAPILLEFSTLRYRLTPYIYSEAHRVWAAHGTIMRPLVMDWRQDRNVWSIDDQFLFGPYILVNPVTHADQRTRSLYLPLGGWTDFWTGERHAGGVWHSADAPIERIPLYVRDGAILPLGPPVQYADEDPFGVTELRVYRGADGAFDLYEDSGDGYAYERGQFSIVPVRWDDAAGLLSIGAREGRWRVAPRARTFRVVLVDAENGLGVGASEQAETVTYRGRALRVSLNR